ncbi:MAG: peptide deformylase [Actinobacteria bacterium]|nr:peptide deformylase [Actinomycetota bacterium]
MAANYAPDQRVRIFGDPVLKQGAPEFIGPTEDLTSLVEKMFQVMDREEGIGLAAPQIGVQKRIMVWRDPDSEDRHVLINPRIVERSKSTVTAEEGCLSVPGHLMEVTRAERVVVEGVGMDGRAVAVEAVGLLARIMQHEIDHLEGHLILDRTSPDERRRVLKDIRQTLDP